MKLEIVLGGARGKHGEEIKVRRNVGALKGASAVRSIALHAVGIIISILGIEMGSDRLLKAMQLGDGTISQILDCVVHEFKL